jgi:tetratricopeptide (TPR) repeat protein
MTPFSRVARASALSLASVLLLRTSIGYGQVAGGKAAAEALFREAAELMAAGNLSEACAKYQASQELDPALGTLLRLADCYDRVGKSASAWALFVEAEVAATRAEQPERAEIAATRAADLKDRLSLVKLVVSEADAVPGLTLTINGADIPGASWGTALPFDPGPHTVTARAPGYRSWTTRFELQPGPAEHELSVPKLRAEPREPQPGRVEPLSSTPLPEQDRSSAQGTIGYVVGGAGLVGLAVGGALAYRAYTLNEDSFAECARDDANACTEKGKELRENAASYGNWATLVGGIGGAIAVTGLVLVLTAPDSQSARHAGPQLGLSTNAKGGGARITLMGAW